MSSISKICDVVVCETVQADRKCEHTESCSPVDCLQTLVVEVIARLTAGSHTSLHKVTHRTGMSHTSCRKAAKTLKLFPHKVRVVKQLFHWALKNDVIAVSGYL
jgi:hypothetical protein